ncbi:MAG: PorT family protein [Fibromonadaceae bacterium]|jgi:hypothetical protein|nr:PorT family protein [Fibromonadaceae bacterium]
MNIFKKIAIFATILCAATVANAQEMTFGARVGYSMQSLDGGPLLAAMGAKTTMGMLGAGVAVVANIPVGPVVVAPEVGFLTRTVANYEPLISIPGLTGDNGKGSITEMAVNIPVMVKFFPREGVYVSAGLQVGIPIGTEMCDSKGKNCEKIDGKEETVIDESTGLPETDMLGNPLKQKNPERSLDIGIPIGAGYMVAPNIGVDFRIVIGLNNVAKMDMDLGMGIIPLKMIYETGSMNTYGVGVTYYF